MDASDSLVQSIRITAIDDASPVLDRLAAKGQEVTARFQTYSAQMVADQEAALAKMEAQLAGFGAGKQMGGFTIGGIEGLADVQAQMTAFVADMQAIADQLGGMAGLVAPLSDALGTIGQAAGTAADGLARVNDPAHTAADGLSAVKDAGAGADATLGAISKKADAAAGSLSALADPLTNAAGGFTDLAGATSTLPGTLAGMVSPLRSINTALLDTGRRAPEAAAGLKKLGESAGGATGLVEDMVIPSQDLALAVGDIADVAAKAAAGMNKLAAASASIDTGHIDASAVSYNELASSIDRIAIAKERLNAAGGGSVGARVIPGGAAGAGAAGAGAGAGTTATEDAGAGFSTRGIKEGARGGMMLGGGILALALGSVWEAGNIESYLMSVAGNTNMTPAQAKSMDSTVLGLMGQGPKGYKDLSNAYLHVASVFPQDTGEQLKKIITNAWKSAIASNSSVESIANALAMAMHIWNVPSNQAGTAMDILHSIGARSNLTVEQLANNMGRSSAFASELNIPLPTFGALFSTITRSGFKPGQTNTLLAGVLQHILYQSKQATTTLDALQQDTGIPIANEFNIQGVRKYGILKVIQDFIDAVSKAPAKLQSQVIGAIIPGSRGMPGILSIQRHLPEMYATNAYLGGSPTGQGPALGNGGSAGVHGITDRTYAAMMATLGAKLKTFKNDVEIFAKDMGDILAPGILKAVDAFKPLMAAMDNFATKHPQLVQAIVQMGAIFGAAAAGVFVLAAAVGALADPFIAIPALIVAAYTQIKPFHDTVNSLAQDALPALKQAFSDIKSFVSQFADDFSKAASAAPEFKQLGTTVGDSLSSLKPAFKDVGDALGLFSSNSKSAGDDAQNLANILTGVLRVAADALGTVFQAAADAVKTQLMALTDTFRTISDAINNFATVVKNIGTVVSDVFQGKWSALPGDVSKVWSAIETLATTFASDFLKLITDLGTNVLTLFEHMGSNILQTVGTLLNTLTGATLPGGLGGMLSAIGDWIGNVLGAIGDGFGKIPGLIGSALGDALGAAGTGLDNLANAFTTFIGNNLADLGGWIDKLPGEGEKAVENLITGVENKAADFVNALKNMVVDAATDLKKAAGDLGSQIGTAIKNGIDNIPILGGVASALSHVPGFGNGANTSPSGTGGGAPSGTLFGTPHSMESAGPLDRAGIQNAAGHTDIQVPQNTPFYLPGGKNAHYTLVTEYQSNGWGNTEVWRAANGGVFDFMHMDSMPGFTPGQVYNGGTYLGLSGGVPGVAPGVTSAYSSGAHLHVGYDAAAYAYWRMVTGGAGFTNGPLYAAYGDSSFSGGGPDYGYGGGGPIPVNMSYFATHPNAAGTAQPGYTAPYGPDAFDTSGAAYGTTLALAGQSPKEKQFGGNDYKQAMSFWQHLGSTGIPDLQHAIEKLPPALQAKYMPDLQNLAAGWRNIQQDYATKTSDATRIHNQNLEKINNRYSEQATALEKKYGINQKSSVATDALHMANLIGKQHGTYTTKVWHPGTAATSGHYVWDPTHKVYVQPKTTVDKLGVSHTTPGYYKTVTGHEVYQRGHAATAGHYTTVTHKAVDETATAQQLAAKDHISLAKAKSMLDLALQNTDQKKADAIKAENTRYQNQLTKIDQGEIGQINTLDDAYQKLRDSVSKLSATDILKGYSDTFSKAKSDATDSLSLALFKGGLHDQVHPLTKAQRDRNAFDAANGLPPEFTPKVTTVADQLQKMADAGAKAIAQQNKLTLAQDKADEMIGKSSGDLQMMNTALKGDVTIATQNFAKDLVNSGTATQAHTQALLQAVAAQQQGQEMQNRVDAQAALLTGDLSGFTKALDSTNQILTQQVTQGFLATGQVNAQLVQQIVQNTDTVRAAQVAQDTVNAKISLASGDLAGFSSDLKKVNDTLTLNLQQSFLQTGKVSQDLVAQIVANKEAQQEAKDVQDGLNAVISAATGNLSDMSSSVKTLSSDALAGWEHALVTGSPDLASFTTQLKAAATASAAVTHAQNLEEVALGAATGDAAQLSKGLKGLLTEATGQIDDWTAAVGRGADGTGMASTNIGQLGQNAFMAAENLSTLSDVISGLKGVVSSLQEAAGTEFMRNGAIDPSIANSINTANKQLTTAQADQVASSMAVAKQNKDLTGYYAALGQAIPYLRQQVTNAAAEYGLNSQQWQAAYKNYQQANAEYEGLGEIVKNQGDITKVATDKVAEATTAFGQFQSAGLDAGLYAMQQYTGVIDTSALPSTQTLANAFQTAQNDVSQLGTQATTASGALQVFASEMGSIPSDILQSFSSISTMSVNAGTVNVNGAPAGSGSGTTSGTTTGAGVTPTGPQDAVLGMGPGGGITMPGNGTIPAPTPPDMSDTGQFYVSGIASSAMPGANNYNSDGNGMVQLSGRTDFAAGKPLSANPYPPGTVAANAWQSGWQQAQSAASAGSSSGSNPTPPTAPAGGPPPSIPIGTPGGSGDGPTSYFPIAPTTPTTGGLTGGKVPTIPSARSGGSGHGGGGKSAATPSPTAQKNASAAKTQQQAANTQKAAADAFKQILDAQFNQADALITTAQNMVKGMQGSDLANAIMSINGLQTLPKGVLDTMQAAVSGFKSPQDLLDAAQKILDTTGNELNTGFASSIDAFGNSVSDFGSAVAGIPEAIASGVAMATGGGSGGAQLTPEQKMWGQLGVLAHGDQFTIVSGTNNGFDSNAPLPPGPIAGEWQLMPGTTGTYEQVYPSASQSAAYAKQIYDNGGTLTPGMPGTATGPNGTVPIDPSMASIDDYWNNYYATHGAPPPDTNPADYGAVQPYGSSNGWFTLGPDGKYVPFSYPKGSGVTSAPPGTSTPPPTQAQYNAQAYTETQAWFTNYGLATSNGAAFVPGAGQSFQSYGAVGQTVGNETIATLPTIDPATGKFVPGTYADGTQMPLTPAQWNWNQNVQNNGNKPIANGSTYGMLPIAPGMWANLQPDPNNPNPVTYQTGPGGYVIPSSVNQGGAKVPAVESYLNYPIYIAGQAINGMPRAYLPGSLFSGSGVAGSPGEGATVTGAGPSITSSIGTSIPGSSASSPLYVSSTSSSADVQEIKKAAEEQKKLLEVEIQLLQKQVDALTQQLSITVELLALEREGVEHFINGASGVDMLNGLGTSPTQNP